MKWCFVNSALTFCWALMAIYFHDIGYALMLLSGGAGWLLAGTYERRMK